MTKRVVITGHVQGVGFRDFTKQTADALTVCGQVWNRRDGAVEALAAHDDPDVLGEFVERLWRGPGSVRDVRTFDADECSDSRFDIRPTR